MADLLEIARAVQRGEPAADTPAHDNKTAPADPHGWGYTLEDLQAIDRLIRELGILEDWTEADIAAKLAERRRMSPGRVQGALAYLKDKHAAALAPWPEKPKKRSTVQLCVIQGGKK